MKKKLFLQKLMAIAFVLLSLPLLILERDATVLVFMLMLAIPMFFSKEVYIR
jgi:hypothetical protein